MNIDILQKFIDLKHQYLVGERLVKAGGAMRESERQAVFIAPTNR
jgi:hypothetical protein